MARSTEQPALRERFERAKKALTDDSEPSGKPQGGQLAGDLPLIEVSQGGTISFLFEELKEALGKLDPQVKLDYGLVAITERLRASRLGQDDVRRALDVVLTDFGTLFGFPHAFKRLDELCTVLATQIDVPLAGSDGTPAGRKAISTSCCAALSRTIPSSSPPCIRCKT